MAAAALADVLVGHPHPPVALGARRSSPRAGRGWAPRSRRAGRARPAPSRSLAASASRTRSSSATPSTRGPPTAPTLQSIPWRGKAEANSSPSRRSSSAIWRRRSLAGPALRAEVDALRVAEQGVQGLDRRSDESPASISSTSLGHEGLPSPESTSRHSSRASSSVARRRRARSPPRRRCRARPSPARRERSFASCVGVTPRPAAIAPNSSASGRASSAITSVPSGSSPGRPSSAFARLRLADPEPALGRGRRRRRAGPLPTR